MSGVLSVDLAAVLISIPKDMNLSAKSTRFPKLLAEGTKTRGN